MSRNLIPIPNPDGSDPAAYINIKLSRAADAGGVPGAFALIATIPIDTTEEVTEYLDATGALTSWYKHQYATLADAILSDESVPIQLGDYLVRQWIKRDIPDTDVVNLDWDNWRDQTFIDMQAVGLGRPAPIQSITPTSFTDYFFGLNAATRRVTRVEVWNNAGEFWTEIKGWQQRGRQIRIFRPITTLVYKVFGRAELRGFNDMDDELFNILYWGMRWRYLLKRQAERLDMRPFLGRTRTADTTTRTDFQALADEAERQYTTRVNDLLLNEGIPDAGVH